MQKIVNSSIIVDMDCQILSCLLLKNLKLQFNTFSTRGRTAPLFILKCEALRWLLEQILLNRINWMLVWGF